MTRRVRLTALLGSAALLLTALASLIALLVGGAAPVLAAAAAAADDTPTPLGSPTPAAVPTISAGTAGSIAPAAPTVTGATIALGLTCVTAVIGLIIAVVTLRALLRGGYGPFLRALVFGSKAGGAQENLNDGTWDASHTLNYRPGPSARDDSFEPHSAYDERSGARRSGARTRGDRSRRRTPDRSRRSRWE
jgi:hypothetical protein